MKELESKGEITPNDYEQLLKLEQLSKNQKAQQVQLSLSTFMSLALRDQSEQINNMQQNDDMYAKSCFKCDQIIENEPAYSLKNCKHCIHLLCAEDLFARGSNKCLKCNSVILEGFEISINPTFKPDL